jgi:hypothetical protein
LIVAGLRRSGRPERAGYRESKTVRHDVDKGANGFAKSHRTSDNQRIGIETGPLEVFSDNDDGLRGRFFVIIKERPAAQRRDRDHTECGRADLRTARGVDASVFGGDLSSNCRATPSSSTVVNCIFQAASS